MLCRNFGDILLFAHEYLKSKDEGGGRVYNLSRYNAKQTFIIYVVLIESKFINTLTTEPSSN